MLLWGFIAVAFLQFAGAAVSVRTKTVTNLGGTGSYDEVVGMPCGPGGASSCIKRPKYVDSCLAPFDEEQSIRFRGPMNVRNFAVYYPTGGSWERVSNFEQGGSEYNVRFTQNLGRSHDGKSVDEEVCFPGSKPVFNGDDFLCHGFNITYASFDGRCARQHPEGFSGFLDDGVEVAALQASECQGDACGFYRGMGLHGWAGAQGGGKIFVSKVSFPHGGGSDSPAIWAMHASAVRTANYHTTQCNCRGVGYNGGCGEVDIAEVVTEKSSPMEVETTVYSYKGAIGDAGVYRFERPVDKDTIYATIYNAEGYIQIVELDWFDFGGSISNAQVAEWNGRREAVLSMPGNVQVGAAW